MYPTVVPSRIARRGTPDADSLVKNLGASPLRVSANSIREVVYSAELRHDSTAVRTMKFITVLTPGMPSTPRTAAYGLTPTLSAFHGCTATTTKIDPT